MKFVDGWLDTAQEYNINGNSWDRGGVPVTHLVIHGTAGGSDGAATMAYMGANGVSTHFALSTDGTIWQGVSCDRAAWGNAPLKVPRITFARAGLNPNLWTVSIEFCKPDITNQVNITDAQKQSGFPLIRLICDTYNIPKRPGDGNGGIISHADINSVDRAHCPGTFPFDELFSFLQKGGGDSMAWVVPAWWSYNAQTKVLTAPNRVQVTDGFAQWVLSHDWDPGNVPLLAALGINPVEQGNPGLGGGTVQPFRDSILAWTAKTNVYKMPAGQEYLALYRAWSKDATALSEAQAHIQELQQQITQADPRVKDYQDRLDHIHVLSDRTGDFLQ